MFSIYTLLLYIHILSAILSIGPLFVVLTIVKKMRIASMDDMPPYIEAFKGSITLVKHSGHVLVASGILLMWHAGYHLNTSWIVLTFLVMFASIVFLARAFKPTLRTFNTPAFNHLQFVSLLHRKTWMYIVLLLIMLWLMVAKPVLW
ncbi:MULTISPECIES: hypothetical protein [Lysinibacillus]|uniref:hypothetical protein n=1 Tax=Lysinibacillus TaxID=400634 RepID=UPI0008249E6D|nr:MULTISPECIES: hypothetical protein [Lysinibacillus]OCX55604.1 hypothetical protein BFM98_05030 [Lysinibacillus sp. AR18-8]